MNHPTREEFDELKEEVRKLKEQQRAEPITIPRIELDPGGIQARLDCQAELLKEQDGILTQIYTDVGKANTEIALLKGEVSTLKQTVATRAQVDEVRAQVDELKQDMQKRFDSIVEVQKLILARLPERGRE